MTNEKHTTKFEVRLEKWGKVHVMAECSSRNDARKKLDILAVTVDRRVYIQYPQSAIDKRSRSVQQLHFASRAEERRVLYNKGKQNGRTF